MRAEATVILNISVRMAFISADRYELKGLHLRLAVSSVEVLNEVISQET